VAGFDPTSGAGITLDLKVFHKYGYHGMGILTSLTAQNTQSVKKIHCPPSKFLSLQYRYLSADVKISGIKMGMIGCTENIGVIAEILAENPHIPVVIDPVFRSGAGNWLLEKKSIPIYIANIQEKASLLTPNLAEAEWISGSKVRTVDDMTASAEKIYDLTSIPCLIKGGHLYNRNIDILFDGKNYFRFKNKKMKKAVHGTGCYLSSSILCHLVSGLPLDRAVSSAVKDTHKAIKMAAKIGKGQSIIFSGRLH
jgi:hydroxymethylpyrimidine kinase/phosphomethylpyrimidine kinase